MDNKYDIDKEKLVSDIVIEPDDINDYKYCIYCNEKLEKELSYCIACGKAQESSKSEADDVAEKIIPIKKFKKIYKKRKTSRKINLLFISSCIFFALSFISLAVGIVGMLFFNNVSVSIFGTNSDALTANQTTVVGSLLISIIFLIWGIFLNCKSEKTNINKKQ